MKTATIAGALGLALLASTQSAAAQASTDPTFSLELRAAAVVPTFDISDAADVGPGFGFGVGYRVAPKVTLMADFDIGLHPSDADPDFKINTLHYMGKVGYDVFVGERVRVAVNLGAGMVQFGGDLPEAKSYPAITHVLIISVHPESNLIRTSLELFFEKVIPFNNLQISYFIFFKIIISTLL